MSAAPELIPRRALILGGGVMAASVLAIGAVRIIGWRPADDAATPALAERRLRFVDRTDGGIDVVDALSGAVIDTAHGEQGFLRGALRGVLRERKQRSLVTDAPLTLTARGGGRLALADPATGARIDLESFGPTNVAVFARWLPSGAKP